MGSKYMYSPDPCKKLLPPPKGCKKSLPPPISKSANRVINATSLTVGKLARQTTFFNFLKANNTSVIELLYKFVCYLVSSHHTNFQGTTLKNLGVIGKKLPRKTTFLSFFMEDDLGFYFPLEHVCKRPMWTSMQIFKVLLAKTKKLWPKNWLRRRLFETFSRKTTSKKKFSNGLMLHPVSSHHTKN